MKKVLIPTYKFTELSEEAKAKVTKEYSEFLMESGITSEYVSEQFGIMVHEAGYPNDDIRWGLNYCQGDGMAFYGHLDSDMLVKLRDRLMPGKGRSLPVIFFEEYIDMTITSSSSHYDHYNTMHLSVDIYRDITPNKQEALDKFTTLLAEDMKDLSKELEKEGYKMLEGFQEEDYLVECLTNLDEDYFEDGNPFHYDHETCLECA